MQHLWEGLDFEDEGESINGELKYRGTDFDHKWHDYIGRSVPEGEGNPPAPLPYQRFHQVPYNALAKTPPMGWNSWNKFGTKITDQLVREIADAMVSSGTRDAGYVYVNIDDGWEGRRDASGVLRPNYGCQVRHLHSWGVYSVPAFAPVLPNDLAYAEWYWHAITEGQKPGAKAVDVGSWAFHKRVFGANFPYQNFATMFRAELFDPEHWANLIAQSGAKYVALTSKHHEGFAHGRAARPRRPGAERGMRLRQDRIATYSVISLKPYVARTSGWATIIRSMNGITRSGFPIRSATFQSTCTHSSRIWSRITSQTLSFRMANGI